MMVTNCACRGTRVESHEHNKKLASTDGRSGLKLSQRLPLGTTDYKVFMSNLKKKPIIA